MGLDIYLYEVSKVENLETGSLVNDNFLFRLLPVYEKNNEIIKYCDTILNNSTLVKKEDIMIDLEKIYDTFSKVQNSQERDIRITGFSNNEYLFRINEELVKISKSDIIEKYSYKEVHEYLAIKLEEVCYQRGIIDNGWEYLPVNCDYCDDKNVVTNLIKNGLNKSFIDNWRDNETVLLAWW